MSVSPTLKHHWAPVREVIQEGGASVPWEVNGYFEDFESSRSPAGGVFDLAHWETVQVEGADAQDYLHRVSTVDMKSLGENRWVRGAFLTGKAHVVSEGFFRKVAPQCFEILCAPGLGDRALNHIEAFHFAEAFKTSRITDRVVMGLWNPSEDLLREWGLTDLQPLQSRVGEQGWEFCKDDCRNELIWITMKESQAEAFWNEARVYGVNLLGQRLFEYYRLLASVPKVGIDVREGDLVLEARMENWVARNKGCYPGQEVVERIFTYGDVNRKLVPVEIQKSGSEFSVPMTLLSDAKEVGTVTSAMDVPDSPLRVVGLAYVRTKFLEAPKSLVGKDGSPVTLRNS